MTKSSAINSNSAPRSFIQSMAVSCHSNPQIRDDFFEVAFLSQTSFYDGDEEDGNNQIRPKIEFIAGMNFDTLKKINEKLAEIIASVESEKHVSEKTV